MTREYGSVQSGIWRDREFRRLNAYPQLVYIMLSTQPDISSCGVLTLAESRWAGYAPDATVDAVVAALDALARHPQRYVLIDHDSGELLVRSFIRHDKGYANMKRWPAIQAAAEAVESPILRGQINAELANLEISFQLRDSLSPAELDALFHEQKSTQGYPEVLVTVQDQVTDQGSNSSGSKSSSSNESNARALRAVAGGFPPTQAGDA